ILGGNMPRATAREEESSWTGR
ncbi:MAG: hypothetical protein QOI82_3042, partial [Actinomycetota bacterium]|nr:hypothetical protein [Actinomycetota bacterium]